MHYKSLMQHNFKNGYNKNYTQLSFILIIKYLNI